MEPLQHFEASRVPRYWKLSLAYIAVWIWGGFRTGWKTGLVSLILIAAFVALVEYLRRKGCRVTLESEALRISGSRPIPKSTVTEISPSSAGVVVSWMKKGVPCYTEIHRVQFEDDVWTSFYEALMAWAAR